MQISKSYSSGRSMVAEIQQSAPQLNLQIQQPI